MGRLTNLAIDMGTTSDLVSGTSAARTSPPWFVVRTTVGDLGLSSMRGFAQRPQPPTTVQSHPRRGDLAAGLHFRARVLAAGYGQVAMSSLPDIEIGFITRLRKATAWQVGSFGLSPTTF